LGWGFELRGEAWHIENECQPLVRDQGISSRHCRIVVCNLADLGRAPAAMAAQAWVGVTPRMITERAKLFNARIARLSKRPHFEVVDLFTASQAELDPSNAYFSPDGFHPSAAGYDRWAELCWPAVWRAVEQSSPG
jgi:acyl-CoA thioesterase I